MNTELIEISKRESQKRKQMYKEIEFSRQKKENAEKKEIQENQIKMQNERACTHTTRIINHQHELFNGYSVNFI